LNSFEKINKKNRFKRWFLAIFFVAVPLSISSCSFFELIFGKGQALDLIESDFVNLDQFERISKFRSCVGHGYPGDDNISSEKHYFEPDLALYGDSNTSIPVYSPFAGKITKVEPENHLLPKYNNEDRGRQIHIKSTAYSHYTAVLFHINQSSWVVVGATVQAGQQIGYADCRYPTDSDNYSNFDIAIRHISGNYFSYFEMLPDSIFVNYQTRGIQSREEMIFTKEERDASPCDWSQEGSSQYSAHWVNLN